MNIPVTGRTRDRDERGSLERRPEASAPASNTRWGLETVDETELFSPGVEPRYFGTGSYSMGGSNAEGNYGLGEMNPRGGYGSFTDAGGFGSAILYGAEGRLARSGSK